MSKAERIESLLQTGLSPVYLEVTDESHMHSVGAGAESHFKVVIVAPGFAGQPLIARHRAVNALVDMTANSIHALALHTYEPGEWKPASAAEDTESPDCLGGSK